MNSSVEGFIALILAYLLGSIPTSVWLGKYIYNKDIRTMGSGNAGATNTFRVFGKWAGIFVLTVDCVKGFAAVSLANFFHPNINSGEAEIFFKLILVIAALLGHLFPVFAGFKGGKGVATLLGAVIAIHPAAAFTSLCVFIACLLITRFVSVSSIVATLSFPIWLVTVFKESNKVMLGFGILMVVLVLITHKKNIKKLIAGEENKVNFTGKK